MLQLEQQNGQACVVQACWVSSSNEQQLGVDAVHHATLGSHVLDTSNQQTLTLHKMDQVAIHYKGLGMLLVFV